jgi:hypothetical protein
MKRRPGYGYEDMIHAMGQPSVMTWIQPAVPTPQLQSKMHLRMIVKLPLFCTFGMGFVFPSAAGTRDTS